MAPPPPPQTKSQKNGREKNKTLSVRF